VKRSKEMVEDANMYCSKDVRIVETDPACCYGILAKCIKVAIKRCIFFRIVKQTKSS
jgi:hypothetical protein